VRLFCPLLLCRSSVLLCYKRYGEIYLTWVRFLFLWFWNSPRRVIYSHTLWNENPLGLWWVHSSTKNDESSCCKGIPDCTPKTWEYRNVQPLKSGEWYRRVWFQPRLPQKSGVVALSVGPWKWVTILQLWRRERRGQAGSRQRVPCY